MNGVVDVLGELPGEVGDAGEHGDELAELGTVLDAGGVADGRGDFGERIARRKTGKLWDKKCEASEHPSLPEASDGCKAANLPPETRRSAVNSGLHFASKLTRASAVN